MPVMKESNIRNVGNEQVQKMDDHVNRFHEEYVLYEESGSGLMSGVRIEYTLLGSMKFCTVPLRYSYERRTIRTQYHWEQRSSSPQLSQEPRSSFDDLEAQTDRHPFLLQR